MDLNGQPIRIVHTHELKVCEHNDTIHHVEYDYYSRRIALVSSDKIVSIYTKLPENKGWTKTGQFKVGGGATWRVRWAHPSHGQVVATASFDGSIYIFQETAKRNFIDLQLSFNSKISVDDQQDSQKEQLVNCEWKQRSSIASTPPTSVVDIRFVPHFFGLMLGACDARGYVTVYEAQNPLSLDQWFPQMKLQIFEYRCKSLAFSTDRFNTLLIATCTDDDRCRSDKQLAIFPFVRNCDIDNFPPPEITYLSPAVGLDSVHLPPNDLEFSPTGAFSFQRLAVAVGSYIVIYHVNAVAVDHASRPDSPTLSESSNSTIVKAPTISVTKPRSDGEEQPEDSKRNLSSSSKQDSVNKDPNDTRKDSKTYSLRHKKSVQFKIDNETSKDRAQSPVPKKPINESNPEFAKIKPSLKKSKNDKPENTNQFRPEEIAQMKNMHPRKSYGSESMDVEASASDEITTPSPIQEDQLSTSASRPIDIAKGKSNKKSSEDDEEKADEADSETSDAPGNVRKKTIKSGYDSKILNDTSSPIGGEMEYDQKSENMSSGNKRSRINFTLGNNESPNISSIMNDMQLSSPTSSRKSDSTIKDKNKKPKKKRHQDTDKNDIDYMSSSSEDTSSKTNIKKHLQKSNQVSSQKTTTEFRSVGGKFESALIKVEATDASGTPIPTQVSNDQDDESDRIKIITLRQAVLKAGKSQTKRLSFNHTGSLITAVYADGRVRVWKRITPILWICTSVIDPPMVKRKEDLTISSEGAYY